MKNIIKDNLISEAGAYGWMLDFGEYTPFDVVLYSKEDPVKYHNRFPLEWAKLNREVQEEVENGDQLVAFMRAGST
jgi:alpha-glucosidase